MAEMYEWKRREFSKRAGEHVAKPLDTFVSTADQVVLLYNHPGKVMHAHFLVVLDQLRGADFSPRGLGAYSVQNLLEEYRHDPHSYEVNNEQNQMRRAELLAAAFRIIWEVRKEEIKPNF